MCTRFRVHHARLALPARSPAELPPSHFHPSQSVRRSRLAPSKAISTLHSLSTLVRRSQLAPSSAPPCGPKPFPPFTIHPRSSGAPVSLPPAEIPLSCLQAISTLSTPSALVPSFLPSLLSFLPARAFLPSFPSFLPSFLSSFLLPPFLPSFLPRSSGSSVSRQSKLNENPSIGDAFGKNKTLVKCIALIRGVSYCGNLDWSRIIQWIGPRKSYMNPQIYQPDMGVDLAHFMAENRVLFF